MLNFQIKMVDPGEPASILIKLPRDVVRRAARRVRVLAAALFLATALRVVVGL